MKRIFLSLMFFGIFSLIANAQPPHNHKHHWGDSTCMPKPPFPPMGCKHNHKHHFCDSIAKKHPKPPCCDSIWKNKHNHDSICKNHKHHFPVCDSSMFKWKHKFDSIWRIHKNKFQPDSANNGIVKAGMIYPNPVTNIAKINVVSKKAGVSIKLDILDHKQQLISSTAYTLSLGGQTLTIDASALPKGYYFVNITGDTFIIKRMFVKLN